jgi:hypothetical protein
MISGDSIDLSGAVWRKSSRSQGQGENCVEVAWMDPHVAVRDSKNPDGTPLIFDREQWAGFLSAVKSRDPR